MPFIDNMNFSDGLEILSSTNYITADISLQLGKESIIQKKIPMNDREKMVRNIRLETQFYSSFRSTVRITLNLYIYRNVKKYIQGIFYSNTIPYFKKLNHIEKELKKIMKGLVIFQEYDEDVLNSLTDIYTCQTDCKNKSYCLINDSGNSSVPCQLILPIYHLVNGESNEKMYYQKLADELLRYRRIQMFMLQPDTYMNFSGNEIDYKVYANEVILPRSLLLDPQYYKELIHFPLHKYARTSTFDTAKPIGKPVTNPIIEWKEEYSKTLEETKKK
jgi:hypothetical protein